jgi:hypothetical protein
MAARLAGNAKPRRLPVLIPGRVCQEASQRTITTGARQNAAFCPVGSSTVTWQS